MEFIHELIYKQEIKVDTFKPNQSSVSRDTNQKELRLRKRE